MIETAVQILRRRLQEEREKSSKWSEAHLRLEEVVLDVIDWIKAVEIMGTVGAEEARVKLQAAVMERFAK